MSVAVVMIEEREQKVSKEHAVRISNHDEVFTINFARHESLPLRIHRTLVHVALVYLVISVIFMIGLVVVALHSRTLSKKLQTEIQGQMALSSTDLSALKRMDNLSGHAAENLNKLNAITTLNKQQFLIGEKLAALAATLPARTWIARLSSKRDERTIKIEAIYLVDPEKPYEIPTKDWIEKLKFDARFSHGLKQLELGPTSRKTQGNAELFSFELLTSWEPVR